MIFGTELHKLSGFHFREEGWQGMQGSVRKLEKIRKYSADGVTETACLMVFLSTCRLPVTLTSRRLKVPQTKCNRQC